MSNHTPPHERTEPTLDLENPYLPTQADLTQPTPVVEYARFWPRVGAALIDFLVLLPLTGLSIWLGNQSAQYLPYTFAVGIAANLLVHVVLVKRYGGTPGKLLLKLKITQLDGSALAWRHAMLRYSVEFVLTTLSAYAALKGAMQIAPEDYPLLTFMARARETQLLAPHWYTPLTYLLMAWSLSPCIVMFTNAKRRVLADFIAGTAMVRTSSH